MKRKEAMKAKVNRREFIGAAGTAAGVLAITAAKAAEHTSKDTTANAAPVCACGPAPKLIFPCSGSADVGAIADQTARTLMAEGVGRMFCLAGIGGRVPGIVETTKCAAKVLVIDGCPLECARKTLEVAGFSGFVHLKLHELGMEKGKTPPTAAAIAKAADAGRPMLKC
jgi:uncharacterized metal-binding protein